MEIQPIKKVTSFHNQLSNQKPEIGNRPIIKSIQYIDSELSEKLSDDELQKDELG